jgi:hypothetical protein
MLVALNQVKINENDNKLEPMVVFNNTACVASICPFSGIYADPFSTGSAAKEIDRLLTTRTIANSITLREFILHHISCVLCIKIKKKMLIVQFFQPKHWWPSSCCKLYHVFLFGFLNRPLHIYGLQYNMFLEI